MRLLVLLLFSSALQTSAQSFPALEKALARQFNSEGKSDGRWVYYPEKAFIQKIEKPLVQAQLPGYCFYKVQFTNYLGYHVNDITCLVLFDSVKSKLMLVPPLWYGDVDKDLVKLFIKKKFTDNEALLAFMKELHGLMETGSAYTFTPLQLKNNTATCDLVAKKNSSITTGGGGATSTITYSTDEVWRTISLEIKDGKLLRYSCTNPVTGEKFTIK